MARTGRPSKYFTHIEPHLLKIRKWRREGITEESIAKTLGVSYTGTWLTYKHKFPEFAEALKEERELVVAKTEESLFNRAWGYRHPQIKETYERDMRTGNMILVKKEILPDKIIPPDINAIKMTLINLDGKNWEDRRTYVDTNGFDTSMELINNIINKAKKDE